MTVFINKGDPPLTYVQAINRGLQHFNREKSYWLREQGILENDPAYVAWANQWVADNLINEQNNVFNYLLAEYRKALQRLDQFVLSEGREAIYEDLPTGEFDLETGEPILETVLVQRPVEALPATIERPVYDPETGEQTGVEQMPNPPVAEDEAERENAQFIVDNTGQNIKDFHAGENA